MKRLSNIPAASLLLGKNLRFLWSARLIHDISRSMEILVLGYLVLDLTDSAFQVALIAVFLNAPRPVLSLFAGLLADRLDRRWILVGVHSTYLFTAATLLSLLLVDALQPEQVPWQVFLAIFVLGIAKVLDDPARRTAIFDLAGSQRIANAMSLETIINNGGKILGPVAGGLLIAETGFTGAYVAIAVLDLGALLLITRVKLTQTAEVRSKEVAVSRGLKEGIRHSVTNGMVFGVLAISLVMNALVLPIQYFIPVIARDFLQVSEAWGGFLGAAGGIGTLFGAAIIGLRNSFSYHGRYFVVGSLTVALGVSLMAWSPWFALSFLLLLAAGIGQAGFSTMQSTILLLSSPSAMRGRIMGSQGLVNGIGHLVGNSEIGLLAGAFGISLAIGLNAGIGFLLILPVVLLSPLVKRPLNEHLDEAEVMNNELGSAFPD